MVELHRHSIGRDAGGRGRIFSRPDLHHEGGRSVLQDSNNGVSLRGIFHVALQDILLLFSETVSCLSYLNLLHYFPYHVATGDPFLLSCKILFCYLADPFLVYVN